MKRKKLLLVLVTIVVIAYLVMLILALTNILISNPFENYRLLIAIGGLVVFGFARQIYKQLLFDNHIENKNL